MSNYYASAATGAVRIGARSAPFLGLPAHVGIDSRAQRASPVANADRREVAGVPQSSRGAVAHLENLGDLRISEEFVSSVKTWLGPCGLARHMVSPFLSGRRQEC